MDMSKTTVYLPRDLKAKLERAATETGRSEADLIREGIGLVIARCAPRQPRIPLFTSNIPDLAERADEYLAGFGED
jgi:hypothetical protein